MSIPLIVPAPPKLSLTPLISQAVSGVTEFEISDIDGKYDHLKVIGKGITLSGGVAQMLARLSVDNGDNYKQGGSDYEKVYYGVPRDTNTLDDTGETNNSLYVSGFNIGNGALDIFNFEMDIYNAYDSDKKTCIRTKACGDDSSNDFWSIDLGGCRNAEESNNAVKIYVNGVTFSGQLEVWGG